MKTGTLIIFSGLPGSGKSTLAAKLAVHFSATYLRIDTIEQGLREICGVTQMDGRGYELAHRLADENLRMGNIVIADSVNPWELTRKAWNSVAEVVGAGFVNVEVICSDKSEHRKRVENRPISVPGLKEPTWFEVVERDFQAWTDQRIVLDTSGKAIEQSFKELLQVLSDNGLDQRMAAQRTRTSGES